MTGIDPGLLLPPDTPAGLCAAGLHEVTGADHAKPIRTPGGVVHVCVYCWQAAELVYMVDVGASYDAYRKRRSRHSYERSALIVDEVAIERVARGLAPYGTLTLREKHTMVDIMRAQGHGARTIQSRTGMNWRVVHRRWVTGYCPALNHWEQGMLDAMLENRQLAAA